MYICRIYSAILFWTSFFFSTIFPFIIWWCIEKRIKRSPKLSQQSITRFICRAFKNALIHFQAYKSTFNKLYAIFTSAKEEKRAKMESIQERKEIHTDLESRMGEKKTNSKECYVNFYLVLLSFSYFLFRFPRCVVMPSLECICRESVVMFFLLLFRFIWVCVCLWLQIKLILLYFLRFRVLFTLIQKFWCVCARA